MEWSDKENRVTVVGLHKAGHDKSTIFKLLKPLGITKMFVYRTIKRFDEHKTIDDLPRSGRPRTVRTPRKVKAVEARIRRNPLRKQKIMVKEMEISPRSMSRLIRDDLGMRAYRRSTGHLLTPALREIRMKRSKQLLSRYAGEAHRNILFTDEKIFTVEESFNRQNDRVYARNSKEASEVIHKVQRGPK